MVLNDKLATNIVHASASLPLPSQMASLQAADPIERIVVAKSKNYTGCRSD